MERVPGHGEVGGADLPERAVRLLRVGPPAGGGALRGLQVLGRLHGPALARGLHRGDEAPRHRSGDGTAADPAVLGGVGRRGRGSARRAVRRHLLLRRLRDLAAGGVPQEPARDAAPGGPPVPLRRAGLPGRTAGGAVVRRARPRDDQGGGGGARSGLRVARRPCRGSAAGHPAVRHAVGLVHVRRGPADAAGLAVRADGPPAPAGPVAELRQGARLAVPGAEPEGQAEPRRRAGGHDLRQRGPLRRACRGDAPP